MNYANSKYCFSSRIYHNKTVYSDASCYACGTLVKGGNQLVCRKMFTTEDASCSSSYRYKFLNYNDRLPGICCNSYIVCRIHILDLDCFASYYRYLCKNCAIFLPCLELRLSRCRRLPSIAKYKADFSFSCNFYTYNCC
jgi:hypothetical protein